MTTDLQRDHLEALFAASPLPALILMRSDGRYVVVAHNDAAREVTGGAAASLVGRTLDDIYGHEPGLLRDVEHAVTTGEPVERETVLRLASTGEEQLQRLHVSAAGEDLVLLSREDLSERRRAERLLGHFVDTLDEGVLLIGPDGRLLQVNATAAQILGADAAELLADPQWYRHLEVRTADMSPTVPGADSPGTQAMLERRAIRDVELRVRRPDGKALWVTANYSPLLLDGAPNGMVVSLRDTTADRSERERFERAFDDAPIGMALTGIDGRYLRVNTELCKLLERSREDIEAHTWQDLTVSEDLAVVEAAVQKLLEGEPIARVEKRCRLPDGRSAAVMLSGSLVRDAAGEPQHLVCQYLDLRERKRYEAELERRALFDHVTDLPNRALFHDRLTHALARVDRTGRCTAVLFVDLDDFKRVNDSLGHAAGDEVLVQVGRRLSGVVRAGDTIARFGGDEFTVLCEDLEPDDADAVTAEIAERMLGELRSPPFRAGTEDVVLAGSVGIAISRQGGTADRLIAEADAAMYTAKREGGGRARAGDDDDGFAARRLGLENALRRALAGEEEGLWIAYQPIVGCKDRKAVGLEALVRWDRPGYGAVSPAELIPVAEESGLVLDLGRWMLPRAMRETLAASEVVQGGGWLSVNLSARQFADPELVGDVRDALEQTGFPPEQLSLEITEDVAMGEAQVALRTMSELKAIGVGVDIDDFGTGFSSLGYLKRFPVDKLKIDRSFICDLVESAEDRVIVEAMVSLGGALGLEVVAEGIETVEQVSILQSFGCRFGQGFLFARPAPLSGV